MSYNIRKEALLNEYKGNLFEFLVSKEIANQFSFESEFLDQFEDKAFEALTQQEEFVRNYYPHYLEFLPSSAKACAAELIRKLNIKKCRSAVVVGKFQATKSNNNDYSEVDLILYAESEIHCSLKFSRYSSFVNTKSGGIKSFISKYFQFDDSNRLQSEFNEFWELEFETFARQMHNSADIEYTQLFDSWTKLRPESLPGELDESFKRILHGFYTRVNTRLSKILQDLLDSDAEQFKQSLFALMGFSQDNIVQVCLFYTKNNNQLSFKNVEIHQMSDLMNLLGNEISIKTNKTNLEVKGKNSCLQIRLKPMNTFTQKGYKINCSVRFS